jgi:hypothetical protein
MTSGEDEVKQEYVAWLAPQISPNRNRDFGDLLQIMFEKEFVFVVLGDDNRIQDGRDLRIEWFQAVGMPHYVDTDILGPVSVLEVLIGLSRRLAFMTSEPQEEWAWTLLKHLELHEMSGRLGPKRRDRISDCLDKLVWRQYDPDGSNGGFFPLAWPQHDQREIEIWSQLNAYLIEHEDPHEEVRMY